ncbi:MAG: putative toxin-antitoxin system toxin component, PIN family [Candidatus Scalindua sp.]|nr:putative toxin-antitoxin system toxin component, PIN family [Candidatus Scalindua sp.]
MIVTMDTNVLLAALISQSGASHKILNLIINETINLALSTQVLLEYDDVLKREEILKLTRLKAEETEDVLDLLALLAQKQNIYYRLRPNLRDEEDNLFVECAFASNSSYLITSNIRDFNSGELKGFGFKTVTPKDFYQMWRNNYE